MSEVDGEVRATEEAATERERMLLSYLNISDDDEGAGPPPPELMDNPLNKSIV
jgi:hypothetical protein